MSARGIQIDVLADFTEERWPSMDLVAEMLTASLSELDGVQARLVRPPMWRFGPPGTKVGDGKGFAASRAMGRFLQYPLSVAARRATQKGKGLGAKLRAGFDSNPGKDGDGRFFHVADHSYGHLVHLLPRGRTGVYCHDLDAFADVLPGKSAPISRRALSFGLLSGLRRAAVVFHSTMVVKNRLLGYGWLDEARLVHAPYGVAPEFVPTPTPLDAEFRQRFGGHFLLHVGSCAPRKNIEFLLEWFARRVSEDPALKLVQAGGRFDDVQAGLVESLGLGASVFQLRDLSREELAALIRCAEVVVVPSLREGFGLPVIEALATGARVLCSDLAVLREVGAEAVEYATTSDFDAWDDAFARLLSRDDATRRQEATKRAALYTWERHAGIIAGAYRALLG